MKTDSMDRRFKNEEEKVLAEICHDMVVLIRKNLAKEFDVVNEFPNYSGLCDTSITMLMILCKEYSKVNNINLECRGIHGEQSHHVRLDSKCWGYQHTWAVVRCHGIDMYVDPTSGQFQCIYDDIPDFYVSTKKPKWYYPDKKNPQFNNRFTRKLNELITFHRKVTFSNGKTINVTDGIIEILQYEVWGKISDMIRKFIK